MALIVEDGTGLALADSYISAANCVAYLDKVAANGALNAFTVAALALQEPALRNATRFLDAELATLFRGVRLNGTMALQWPRSGAITNDNYAVDAASVPALVLNATCELGLRYVADTTGHVTSRLLPDVTTQGTIQRKKNKIGPLEQEIAYMGGASQKKLFSLALAILRPLLWPPGRVVLA